MSAALIAMTILGCNDAVTDCRYVGTVDKKWETVADCNAASETRVQRYANVPYPTVIAVCEEPKTQPATQIVAAPVPAPAASETAVPDPVTSPSFAARIAADVRAQLPSGTDFKQAISAPVHFVSDGYSWMARRLAR